jgi:hypothetical protein
MSNLEHLARHTEAVARAMAKHANDYEGDVLQWECWIGDAQAAIAAMLPAIEEAFRSGMFRAAEIVDGQAAEHGGDDCCLDSLHDAAAAIYNAVPPPPENNNDR